MFLQSLYQNRDAMRKGVVLVLLLGLVVMSSFFSGEWNQWLLSIFLVVTFGLAFFVVLLLGTVGLKLSTPRQLLMNPHLPLFLFLLIACISTFFSNNLYTSLNVLSLLLCYALVFWAAYVVFRNEKFLRILVITIFSTGALASLINIILFIFVPESTRAGGLLFNANALGSYLLFSLPIGMVLLLEAKGLKIKIALSFGTLLIGISFILTFSYTGWVSFLIPLIILGFVYRKKIFSTKNVVSGFGIALILLAIVISIRYVQYKDFGKAAKLYETISASGAAFSFHQRIEFNRAALNMSSDYPFTGVGLSAYQQMYPRYTRTIYEQPRYVHNYYLQTLAEIGFVGFIVFVWFIVALLRKTRTAFHGATTDDRMRPYIFGLSLGVLGSVIHALFDFGWQFPAVFLLFWVCAGALLGYENATQPPATQAPGSRGVLWKALILIAGLLLLVRGFTLFLAMSSFDQAVIAANNGEYESSIEYAKQGVSYSPDPEQFRALSSNTLQLAHSDEDYTDAVFYAKRAIAWNKSDYFAYRLLGRIFITQGRYADAETAYKTALMLDPMFHPQFHYDLAVLYDQQKRYDDELQLLTGIIARYDGIPSSSNIFLPGDLSLLHYQLGHVYEIQENNERAQYYYEQAIRLNDKNSSAQQALDRLKAF